MTAFPNMDVLTEAGPFDGEGSEVEETFAKIVTDDPNGRETVIFVYWSRGGDPDAEPYIVVDVDGPARLKVVQNDYTVAEPEA